MKKILSVLLTFCIMNFSLLPAFADEENYKTSHVIDAQFKTELNVNKASKGQVVQFVSTEDYEVGDVKIPSGTIFSGKIKRIKKGRCGYRRAKVLIVVDEMIFPNGETHTVKAFTKKHVLKGPAMANIGKGIVTAPAALMVGVAGAVVIVVEAISIAGIVLIAPTACAFCGTMGKLTNGINCTKHEGDEVKLKIKSF